MSDWNLWNSGDGQLPMACGYTVAATWAGAGGFMLCSVHPVAGAMRRRGKVFLTGEPCVIAVRNHRMELKEEYITSFSDCFEVSG